MESVGCHAMIIAPAGCLQGALNLEMCQEDTSLSGLRMTLPRGTVRDRSEQTRHSGRSSARSPIARVFRLTRTDALRPPGRIASP
jgi:hypothetical protein